MEKPKITLYEDEIYGQQEAHEPTLNLVVFKLNEEWYGIDIMHVSEVVPAATLTVLPNIPEHILGIFNLRGNIVPVTDLKRTFNLGPSEVHAQSRIVVVCDQDLKTGLLIDGREYSLEIPLSKIESTLPTLDPGNDELIIGQFESKSQLIAVLSAPKLLEKTRL